MRPAVWYVIDRQADRSFTWVSRHPGLRVVAAHEVRRLSASESEVTLRIAFSGALAWILGRLFRSLTQSYLAQEGVALKQRVEQRGDVASGSSA
jgi:hypothetical protein